MNKEELTKALKNISEKRAEIEPLLKSLNEAQLRLETYCSKSGHYPVSDGDEENAD